MIPAGTRCGGRRADPGRAARGALVAAILAFGAAGPAPHAPRPPEGAERAPGIYGFRRDSLLRQRETESELLRLADAARIERHARVLTQEPHVAGTPENAEVARYILERFKEAGLSTELKSYRVYMGFVKTALLEQVAPGRKVLSNREEGIRDDKDSFDRRAALGWNAYSPSGDVTRQVVYVNYARPEDFAALAGMGISVKDRILLARYFKGYRGGKALEAQRRGAAGIIFYTDPADDGYVQGDVYPEGPWGPDSHVQRGATVFDFIVPGDPLTPGSASLPGARRIRPEESEILPRIPSIPISARDARVILSHRAGPVVPRDWQGGLPLTYHVGPGASVVHLKVESSFETRTITDVVGILPGTVEPDKRIVLGNHHDAWVYGAVDPISGTAVMIELARVAGELARRGFGPKRTLVFGNWDAEEWTLTGSTEWGEEFRDDLAAHGVACLNVDSAVSGSRFQASAVPTLRRLLSEALRDVPDPKDGRDLLSVTAGERGIIYDVLGSGSDYTVFFNHIGMPSLDAAFEGPYGVYHSIFDSHAWMSRFGDPGFLYHAAMVRLWGLLAYRLANADILPFEEGPYPAEAKRYLGELERAAGGDAAAVPSLADLRAALSEWDAAAAEIDAKIASALESMDPAADLVSVNDALMRAERDLLDPAGIPKRPWFRHLLYAPLPTYAAETLPGLREAVEEKDLARARSQAATLASAVRRRIATLRAAAGVLAR